MICAPKPIQRNIGQWEHNSSEIEKEQEKRVKRM